MPLPWLTIPISLFAALFAVAALVTFAPALAIRRAQRAELKQMCGGKLALTYDDGPGKRFTPQLLDLLKKHAAQATFYYVGFRMNDAPTLVERTIAEGHEVGNHGYWHRNAWRTLPWTAMKDVREGFAALRQWHQTQPYYRPPFGRLSLWNWLAARELDAPVCWWTCDARDQTGDLSNAQHVIDQITNSGGGVVLMHSHDSGAAREQYVLELTERLLHAAREHNLTICTMSEVLGVPTIQKGEAAA